MLSVAICDDDMTCIENIEQTLNDIVKNIDIYKYTSAKGLIQSKLIFDIAFLDIEMENDSGFDAAEYVKKINPDCIIAFFTNYESYARKGYEYRAYRFILKDEGDTLIRHHFAEIIKEYYRLHGQISLIYGQGKKIEYIKNIMYIKMDDHYGSVYLRNGDKCLLRKTLSNIEKELAGFTFIRCHNSYIVNTEYIALKKKRQFILTNGVAVPIGKLYSKDINTEFKS